MSIKPKRRVERRVVVSLSSIGGRRTTAAIPSTVAWGDDGLWGSVRMSRGCLLRTAGGASASSLRNTTDLAVPFDWVGCGSTHGLGRLGQSPSLSGLLPQSRQRRVPGLAESSMMVCDRRSEASGGSPVPYWVMLSRRRTTPCSRTASQLLQVGGPSPRLCPPCGQSGR
jgi:hypothetical protein